MKGPWTDSSVEQLCRLLAEPDGDELKGQARLVEDWPALLQMSDSLQLALPLWSRLSSVVPRETASAFQEHMTSLTLQSLAGCQELLSVLDLLRSTDIRAIPYKGPSLGVVAFGSATGRTFNDLDLLVHPEQYQAAAGCLVEAGYAFACRPTPRCHLLQAYETTLTHPERRLSVDLHRCLLPPSLPDIDRAIRRRLVTVEILGTELETFGPEELLLLLLAHGSKHLWRSLRWLYDIHRLVTEQSIDWISLYSLAFETRWLRGCKVGLELARQLFSTEVHPLFLPDRRDLKLAGFSRGLLPFSEPSLREMQSYHWHLCETLGDKVRYFIQTVFAPHELDLRWVDLPHSLYPLYYLLRPLRKASALLFRTERA